MSFYLEAGKYRPEFLFMMDDVGLTDYSPYHITASVVGSALTRSLPLVKGADYAPVIGPSTVTINKSVYNKGEEQMSFSLMAVVLPVLGSGSSGTQQQILSNSGNFDGLSINGTVVSFSTKYATTGEAKCSYDLQVRQTAFVVGTHTESKNSLYVNGELVAEVDITDAQRADTYITTDSKSYVGTTGTSSSLVVNAIGGFRYSLPAQSVKSMYASANDMMNAADITTQQGGSSISMTAATSALFLDFSWKTQEDWSNATLQNATVVNSQLVPQFDGNTSMAGTWLDSISLSSTDATSVHGIVFDWQGSGVTLSASLDGVTWETLVKGVSPALVPVGFNPTGKDLYIRAQFAGGIVDDTSYLDTLTVLGYNSSSETINGRTVTLSKAYKLKNYPTNQFQDLWGTTIQQGGSVIIGTDSVLFNPQTIELWIKRTGNTLPTISASGTMYQDGVPNSSSFVYGKWTLVHITLSSAYNSNIIITGPAQLGPVGLYAKQFSSTDVANIVSAFSKTNVLAAPDTSNINISQPAVAAQVYAHDWAIVGAG